jgi:lipopolysaccharide export system protein LptA
VYQRGTFTAVGDPANRVISAQGPLLVRCANGEELRADSAVVYQGQNEVHLFRQVDYQDPAKSLTSDQAIYNSGTGRLYATGNVVFTDKNQGSTLRGPELEYFRAMQGRPQSQATATQRPHVTVTPKGSGSNGRRREPMEIDADRVTSVGDRYMTATGNVVINDNGTRSTAEEAYYDQAADHVELRRQARVDNEKYHLTGDFIASDLQNGSVSKVLAQNNAQLVSDRLTVNGPQLQLFFERDLLQRMVSGHVPGQAPRDSAAAAAAASDPATRSVALAKGFRLEGDSIEAITPDQQVRQVNAIGKAHGESWDTIPVRTVHVDSGGAAGQVPATPRPMTVPPEELDQKDVLTADTIIAFFRTDSAGVDSVRARPAGRDSVRLAGRPAATGRDTARPPGRPGAAQGDTTKTEIERLLALGDARSLYRMRNDSTKASGEKPGLNYLIGDRIDLRFKDGEVDVAHVRGLKQGVYLDPRPPRDSAAAANDSARATGARRGAPGRTNTARPGTTTRPATPSTAPSSRPGVPANIPVRTPKPSAYRPATTGAGDRGKVALASTVSAGGRT